jgi:CRISPR-associated Csx2 family protein
MARKVFISFLGNNNYLQCHYNINGKNSVPTRFVQEALINHYCSGWSENDEIIIFGTQGPIGSIQKNWLDNGQERIQENKEIENRGLYGILKSKNIKAKLNDITPIPEGFSEKEIWEIFNIVFDKLQPEDEIYLDVTHAFRSIPIFSVILLNYARLLKNTKLIAIHYGAFKKLGPASEVKSIPVEQRLAPVLDLMPLVSLQDWTIAANEFINFGNADRVKMLTDLNIVPILKETHGHNQNAQSLRALAKNLSDLSEDIKTNRGKAIINGKIATNIISALVDLQQNIITPLNPIIEKIKTSVTGFHQQEEVKNMLHAVKWCIEKNLIQEGFTLLQEGLISLLLSGEYENEKKRNFVSGYLTQFKSGKFENTRFNLTIIEVMNLEKTLSENPKITDWANIFSQITDIRNDINHAGIRQNPLKARDFKPKLEVLYEKTNQLLLSVLC